MHRRLRFAFFTCLTLAAMAAGSAPTARAQSEKDKVLRRLDAAAAAFHSAQADFQADTEQLDPVPDTDMQSGVMYYERKGAAFKMAAHIEKANGKPITRFYTYSGGQLTYYDKPTNQVTRFSKAGQFESYLMLGFGAGGKELEEKWDVKYLGSETLDGVKTEKLELVARDAEVRKVLSKVTIWVDPERAVSLKQRFDEGPSMYRICTYSHFRINQAVPPDAFTFKTDAQTQYNNR